MITVLLAQYRSDTLKLYNNAPLEAKWPVSVEPIPTILCVLYYILKVQYYIILQCLQRHFLLEFEGNIPYIDRHSTVSFLL